MHTRLLGALRLIDPTIPTEATNIEAWKQIAPKGNVAKGNFWCVLRGTLPFARSSAKQIKIAEWIIKQKELAKAAGHPWPPKPIVTNNKVFIPQPQP